MGKCTYCDKEAKVEHHFPADCSCDGLWQFALVQCLQKFDRIITKYVMPMVQTLLLVFLNVSGNISGRRIKTPMETVLGLINSWLKDGIKLVHCYLGLPGGCWCDLGHGCVLPLFIVCSKHSKWGDPAGSVIAVSICLHCCLFSLI